MGVLLNPEELRLAQSDQESFSASLINIASLLDVPINASRFEDQLNNNNAVSALCFQKCSKNPVLPVNT